MLSLTAHSDCHFKEVLWYSTNLFSANTTALTSSPYCSVISIVKGSHTHANLTTLKDSTYGTFCEAWGREKQNLKELNSTERAEKL